MALKAKFVMKPSVYAVAAVALADAINGAISKESGSIAVIVDGVNFLFVGVDEMQIPPDPSTTDAPTTTPTAELIPLTEEPANLDGGETDAGQEAKVVEEAETSGKTKSMKPAKSAKSNSKSSKILIASTDAPASEAPATDAPEINTLDGATVASKIVTTAGKAGKAAKAAKGGNVAAKSANVASKAAKVKAKAPYKSGPYRASERLALNSNLKDRAQLSRAYFVGGMAAAVLCIALYVGVAKYSHNAKVRAEISAETSRTIVPSESSALLSERRWLSYQA